ncbi:MAG: macro domain-containing protein [Candidatus Izemoplasmatales bacterium]
MPFQIIRQDITKMKVDAIVNSADPKPIIGGGVDLAIHKAGGQNLVNARIALGSIRTCEVKYTKAYLLPAKYVIHTVGPVWKENDPLQDRELYLTYENSLRKALDLKCESIAFPLISAGVFAYPKEKAIEIATKAIKDFLENHEMMVYLVIFDQESYILSKTKHQDIQSYIDEFDVYQQDLKELDYFFNEVNLSKQITRMDEFDFLDDTWQEALMKLIIESGETNASIYKKANITKQLFSKILKDKDYHPSKATAVAFCIALELDLYESIELLEKAGYQLSLSIRFDIIIRYYLEREIYDIFEINETLFEFDQELLGSTILT